MNVSRTFKTSATSEKGQLRLAVAVALALMVVAIALSTNAVKPALGDPASPIAVTKTANPSPVVSGTELTYTITIKNTGGSKVSNLVMTDQVNGVGVIQNPPALPQLIITSTQGNCAQGGPNGNLVTCNGGTLAGGATWVVTIRGQVTAANGTTLNNTASVTGTRSAQNFTTNATVQVLVQSEGGGKSQPDLTINKTGPTSVAVSSPMTYTLTVNNIGTASATNVKVVDTVPAGVNISSATATSLFVCSVVSQTVTCTGGAVNAGANATITINGTSPTSAGTITNTAVVDPDNTIAESNELNNTSATVNTSVGGPPAAPLLDVKKTDGTPAPPGTWWAGAGPDPVNPGQQITYKILVTNNATGSNSRADDVVVTDGTQGLDAGSVVATQVIVNGTLGNTGGCAVIAPEVKCSIRSLNSGGTLTITITGTVLASAGSTIFNTATATGNIKNTGVSNTASEATTVRPAVDLTITKDDSPDPVCARSWPNPDGTPPHLPNPPNGLAPPAGGTVPPLLAAPVCLGGLTYTFVVGNSGTQPVTGVTVRDPLPAGLIFDSYEDVDSAGFVCSVDAGNVITCTGGSLPAGPAATARLKFLLVAEPNVGNIANTVYVDPNNAIFEADETNNTFSQPTQVSTGIDLVVWKSDSNPADPPGNGAPSLAPNTMADGFDPVATRGTETYTIYVDNVGAQDATGIRLRDALPADTIFLSVIADPAHGFTCAHDGSATGGIVECVGGHILGTESEFYDPAGPPPAGPGDDFATVKIKVFARRTVGAMHNEVRVDPFSEIAEANELNNLATDDTTVTVGNSDRGAYQQLAVAKTHVSPASGTVATNGTLTYDLAVTNLGTDPVSNIVLKDTLPAGTRYIQAKDTDTGSAAFFCSHDGAAFGGVITCVGGDLDGTLNTIPVGTTTRHVTVKVFAPNTPATYTNLATVDPDNIVPEGNEFDNDAQLSTIVAPCVDQTSCTDTNAFQELTISKSQVSPPDPVARNGIVTYDLLVTNLGSDPVTDITVQDAPPAGSVFIDAKDTAPPLDPHAFSCGAPDAFGVLTCVGGSLSGTVNVIPGGVPTSRTIQVRVFAPDTPGTYPNQAIVDPANAVPEGNEFNNVSAVSTVVTNGGNGPYIDLTIVKTGTTQTTPGGQLIYNLHVSNNGAGDAFNVTVRDVLPGLATFFNAADAVVGPGMFTCSFTAPNLDCTGGTIPAGGSRNITVLAIAPTNIAQYVVDKTNVSIGLTNQAFVDPDNAIPEGDETNNAHSIDTSVTPAINLTLDKQGPDTATQNDTTQYTIKVTNNKVGSGATAFGVKIVDPLPVGLIPLSITAEPGNFECKILENPVNYLECVGDLEAGKDVTITAEVFVTQDGGTLDNEACVDPDNVIDETNELDNCKHAIGQVLPPFPNLLMNKTADKGSVTEGEELTYTLTVSNVGTGDASGTITVSDTVPSQVTVTNISPDGGWDCSASSGNVVSCERTDLAKGASSHIVVTTTVNAGVTAPFPNTASVNGGGDTSPANNVDTVTTSVGGAGIDLTVASITDNPDPVNARPSQLTYTIVAVNNGTAGASPNAVVRVELPDMGISVQGVSGTNGFNCSANTTVDPSGMTYDCVGDFGASGSPNGTTEITAIVTVNAGAPNDLVVHVTVDPDNDFGESDESNNSLSETTTVSGSVCTSTPCVDLVVADVFDNPDPATAPATITYVASIVNVGDSPVPPSAIWDLHFQFFGTGTMTISAPASVTCSNYPSGSLDSRHQHCISTSGSDPMDLGPGAGLTFTITVTGVPASTVSLNVNADIFGVITEFSESNNSVTETTTVNP